MFARLSAIDRRHYLVEYTNVTHADNGRMYLFYAPLPSGSTSGPGWDRSVSGSFWIKDRCLKTGVAWGDVDGDGAGKSLGSPSLASQMLMSKYR